MTSHALPHGHSYSRSRVVPGILVGGAAGVVASVVMGLYAMIVAAVNGTGFFTPLYHIASLWLPPSHMMISMEAGMAGDAVTFLAGPAVVGLVIHMMTGFGYGALFGLIVSRFRIGRLLQAASGLVWGLVVFLLSTFIGLPVAAAIFGAGQPIASMPAMAGWGTFVIEHLLFGLVVGILYAFRPGRWVAADD